ncbi:hypothetical protein FACS1894142_5510 [Spirochaetia bacterium]|nr:hypothetical protein FACS1894142_5510 [Spirochaetia bacterium]
MKRYVLFICFGLLIISGVTAQSLRGRTMYVASKTAELKASTGFFAEILETLQYGDQVTVLQEDGKWVEVRWVDRPSITGWMVSANLTTKRITASGSETSATANELALAGKGFTEEVEDSYKTSGAAGAAHYTEIDIMEGRTISKEGLYRFLAEGHLATGDQ